MSDRDDEVLSWLDEHAAKLLLYARQWVGSHAEAEDVFQEAFVRFWRRRERVRDPQAYLYRSVRNVAMNSRRSRQRRRRIFSPTIISRRLMKCRSGLRIRRARGGWG